VLLVAGLVLLAGVQALHFADVLQVHGIAGRITMVIRANITPFAWCAYLLFLLGVLTAWDGHSWLLRYRNRFALCWLWSIPAWCYFDWMNFYFMRDPASGRRAWEYVNLPPRFEDRLIGYLLAFGAIAPGMFLTSELLQRIGFHRLRTRPMKLSSRGKRIGVGAVFLLGVVLAPIPVLVGTPASNLAIWVGTWALLDPLNLLCGRPSILRDWSQGRFGRTLALGAGGLICGFLWEFWNYWSWTKWVYHLPFLGNLEHYRYFEMPLLGLIGFIAFGIETWTMWQTALLLLAPFVEGERLDSPADQVLHERSCF
jgi:hypothetical protein